MGTVEAGVLEDPWAEPPEDIYAYGVILFWLATGLSPMSLIPDDAFDANGRPRREWCIKCREVYEEKLQCATRSVVPRFLVELCVKCLKEDPQQRPQNGEKLLHELLAGCRDDTTTSMQISLVRSLVENHGGSVSLLDRAPHGLIARVLLPQATEGDEQLASARAKGAPALS
mgnify:CR=1 FL=1